MNRIGCFLWRVEPERRAKVIIIRFLLDRRRRLHNGAVEHFRRLAATLGLCTLSAAAYGTGATVAIDVGHSVQAPGATSARGRVEFEFNRDEEPVLASGATRQRMAGAVARGLASCLPKAGDAP
jgi:hypothetical protein